MQLALHCPACANSPSDCHVLLYHHVCCVCRAEISCTCIQKCRGRRCYFPFLWVVSSSLEASGGEDAALIGVAPQLFRDPRFWLVLVVAATAALMFDLLLAALTRHLSPSDSQILQVHPNNPACFAARSHDCQLSIREAALQPTQRPGGAFEQITNSIPAMLRCRAWWWQPWLSAWGPSRARRLRTA